MKPAAIFSAILLCLAFAAPVHAVQCDVPHDYATIQLAVDDLACSDIVVAAGTFNAAVVVGRNLTIRGAGRFLTFIEEQVTINNNAVLSLRHLTVQKTSAHGVLLDSKFAELDGDDIEIALNSSGSGVHHGPLATDAIATLRNCDIHDNQRGILTPVIDMDNCNVTFNLPLGGIKVNLGGTIFNSSISANQNTFLTSDGGGILFEGPGGTTLTIEDSTISANVVTNASPATTTADGGGIMLRAGVLYLRRSQVTGNVADRFGGGVAAGDASGRIEIEDSYFNGNIAYGGGGAIGAGDKIEIANTLIEGNRAWFDDTINMNGSAVGGGIYAFKDRLTLIDSTVRLNVVETQSGTGSTNSGGGLYINTNLPVVIEGSTINGNFAEVDGGGLYVNSETTVTNTTIAANRANRDGGGVLGGHPPFLLHATVVENIADDDNTGDGDGGGLFGNVNVNHSLIGYNVDKSSLPKLHPDCSGAGVSSGYSFLRIGEGCTAFDGGPGSGDKVGTIGVPFDLGLVLPIANNGGPSQTAALDTLSPARDAGEKDCELVTAMDQRGYSRVAQDGNLDSGLDGDYCDIGAFEAFSGCQAAPLVLTNVTYNDFQTIQSESTLATVGSVIIDVSGKVVFEAGSTMSFGNGFQVATGGQFTALIGAFSCT